MNPTVDSIYQGTLVANILIIEDDDILRRSYARMFRDHFVVAVASGEDAVEEIIKNPLFDVVLSDYKIDGCVDGGQVFGWVKQKYPKLVSKYIFVSSEDAAEELCKSENLTFLMKPSTARDVMAAVAQKVG